MTMASTTGVRRFLGPGDPDHLDPASAYHVRPGQLRRMVSRQLFVFAALDAPGPGGLRFVPVPDVATEVPTRANGGVDETGTRYVIRLRGGVWWNGEPGREVVAQDFVRGFERLAHLGPGHDALRYFTDTIEEVRAADDATLHVHLRRPANDLVDLLSLGYVVAVPREHEALAPGTPPGTGTLSNGPYQVTRSAPGETVLIPNPSWRRESDPVRTGEHARVEVVAPPGDEQVRREIADGVLTPAWSWGVVPGSRAAFPDDFPGFTLNPYLVFNLRSPNANRAVRHAVAHAVDKVAVDEIVAGLRNVATLPIHSVLPPGNLGHSAERPALAPAEPDRARALLGTAGRPVLRAVVRDIAFQREVMASIAADLDKCGITLDLDVVAPPRRFYGDVLHPDKDGAWDLALVGWTPDWFGNNGRAVLRPMFGTGGDGNFGGYSEPEVDALMDQALEAPDPARAAELWRAVDDVLLRDLPVVPLLAFACMSCAARTGSMGWPGMP